jgi:hypothetical protein
MEVSDGCQQRNKDATTDWSKIVFLFKRGGGAAPCLGTSWDLEAK